MVLPVRFIAGYAVWIIAGFCIVLLTGCERNSRNFSQYPGFAEYFASNPPIHELPTHDDKQLLYRFQPRFMLAEGQDEPIDFYRDYIARGVLIDGQGNVISAAVTQELLNSYRDNPYVVFRHVPVPGSSGAVVYGRVDRQTISFVTDNSDVSMPLTFLTYHVVFRNSGIPAGIPAWQEALLGLLFDIDDWHQLDHYTAVSLVVEENERKDVQPVAVMLQQHDNLRTYLIGESLTLPEDERAVIDIAKRSNELYPHTPNEARHRAVYMPDPAGMRFLLTGDDKPLFASYDVTNGTTEVNYTLDFLPHDDAFYTFKGYLGERRRLKGRDAPPGADYNTLPELKPLQMQLFSGYWRENNPADVHRFEKTILRNGDYTDFAQLQGSELYRNLKLHQQRR
jgi:hypothetical protein